MSVNTRTPITAITVFAPIVTHRPLDPPAKGGDIGQQGHHRHQGNHHPHQVHAQEQERHARLIPRLGKYGSQFLPTHGNHVAPANAPRRAEPARPAGRRFTISARASPAMTSRTVATPPRQEIGDTRRPDPGRQDGETRQTCPAPPCGPSFSSPPGPGPPAGQSRNRLERSSGSPPRRDSHLLRQQESDDLLQLAVLAFPDVVEANPAFPVQHVGTRPVGRAARLPLPRRSGVWCPGPPAR